LNCFIFNSIFIFRSRDWPDPAQERVLASGSHRGILNCTRQWGKSTVTAAKAVHRAYTEGGSLTLVVSPSARQSGEFVRKAEGSRQCLYIRQCRCRSR
jgi:hypothetical protein